MWSRCVLHLASMCLFFGICSLLVISVTVYAVAVDGTDAEQRIKNQEAPSNTVEALKNAVVDSYFSNQFSTESLSPDINAFHDKIRRKFGLLDLRPKDGCPSDGNVRTRNMFYCPTPNPYNVREWKCVMTDELCNGIPECPGSEDEDPTLCLFWLAGQEQLRQLRKIMVRQFESDSFMMKPPSTDYNDNERSSAMRLPPFPYRISKS